MTRFFGSLLAVMLLVAAPFAQAAPTTPTEDFTDNLDGTVTHRITGMTWMRCVMGMTWTGTTCVGTASTYTWDQATKLTLSFAGKSDWRLPSVAELNTIVERYRYLPAINVAVFPSSESTPVWSASTYAADPSLRWQVDFSFGFSESRATSVATQVRLVSTSRPFDASALYLPNADFADNGDGTSTHRKTGLMWKRCLEGQTWDGSNCTGNTTLYDWGTAEALTSSSAGHSDWRLPSVQELLTIVEYQSAGPASNKQVFPGTFPLFSWSGTPISDRRDGAWVVNFSIGGANKQSSIGNFSVRLVRVGDFFGPLGFKTQISLPPGTVATSNTLKVTGVDAPSSITSSGGTYSINGTAYTSNPGMVSPNDTVAVRLTAAPTPGATTRATLTIGGVGGTFSVVTSSAGDSQAPSTPPNLLVKLLDDRSVNLSWSPAVDDVGVTAHRVYRNGILLSALGNVTTFKDFGLSANSAYMYEVVACDAANNCSPPSLKASVALPAALVERQATPNDDFVDNGDGTVTHRKTGLTWMRCAMGMTWTGATCTGTATKYTWEQATKLTSDFAGKSDWGLPNVAEMSSVVEWSSSGPKANMELFPNTPAFKFWSSTSFLKDAAFAWYVNLYGNGSDTVNYGVNGSNNPTFDKTSLFMARLVRGRQVSASGALFTPTADFQVNGDGTATHFKTGLMWKQCAEGQTWSGSNCLGAATSYDWISAIVQTSNSAGYSDWRLPTVGELLSTVEYQANNPAINSSLFQSTTPNFSFFWSSSANTAAPAAWYVSFDYGVADDADRFSPMQIRLVRNGQYFSPLGFASQSGATLGAPVASSTLKVSPNSAPAAPITISGGQYSINGGTFTSASGTINPNDSVTVRVTAAPAPGTATRTTLTIGIISGDFTVTTAADSQPPLSPASLTATSPTSPTSAAAVKLAWPPAADNTDVTHYRINRNGALLAVVNTPITTFTDIQPTNSTQFTYTVQACDAAYNCSTLSSTASAFRTGAISIAPQLSTGAGHSAGIKNDGGLFTWGFNEAGQLGTGVSGDPRTSPQRPSVSQGSGFTSVATGSSHSLAIKLDGSLWTWGGNASGQLGDGTITTRNTPVQIGSDYMTVAAGSSHSLAIKTDGTLWSWGNNGTGQLGDGTSNSTSTPIQIGIGFYTVSAGTSHTVAIKTDGTLWAWGSNNFGQLGDGTGNDRYSPQMIGSGFTAAAAGAFHTVALKNDGTLWAWGQNTNGQLGDGTTQNRYAPVLVGSGYNVLTGTLAAGNAHSLAIKPDGSLWAWGRNASGQLGDGTTADSAIPKAIEPTSVFTTLAANANHTLAMKPDGTVWSWGANSTGQLGDATLASRQSSVLVLNETVDGALDLIAEEVNTIPADKLPSFLVQVAKSANVTSTIKYNPNDLNQTGSVYVVAYLRPDSPLLVPSITATSKIAGSQLTKDTGCPAGTAGTVPAVLTRGGWKQTDCTTPTLPLYTGTLGTANNTFGMFDSSKFDQTKDNGLFCVAYAGPSTASAKGLIRSVVSGVDANLNICPPIQIGVPADTAAPSIPLNIAATAAGPGQVNLSWNAATDNTAVVRYNIYRGTTLIATLDNVTSYTDNSLQASMAYSYSVMACDAAANCSGQSIPAQTATPAQPDVALVAGWNLVGNGGSTAMNVPSLFGDASKIYSLWKWVKAGSSPNITYPAWGFYSPMQADGGVAYAASNGFEAVTTIASGEGFWVNAKLPFSVPMTAPAWILSSVFAPNQSKALTPGWSMIATGEAQTASAFNKAMSATPPTAEVIPINLTSLWAWQNSAQRWYFYAPSLDASGELATYLTDNNYLNLAGFAFTPTMGFWVNKP